MGTEVWFRNPGDYVRELVEAGEAKIAWDRGYLAKKKIDADKHGSLFFGRAYPWQALLIGTQGTAHINADNPLTKPLAVYPTWAYGDDAEILEEIIAHPVGQDVKICGDSSLPPDERPVLGQPHRVVITDMPDARSGPGRKFLRHLKGLQEEFPECILHVHGLYSFRMAFGLGFGSADYEPRSAAQKGKLHLPSGREEKFEKAQSNPQWVTVLGFKPVDMQVPRNRCIYNIKSAVWAGENYEKLYKFNTGNNRGQVDTETPDAEYEPKETRSHLSLAIKPKEGDQFHCDTCSLQDKCKYQRAGAVCSVPGAEPTELARFFKTRDSETILDGLGTLVAAQTRRLERGMQEEEDFGELNPEVTKLINAVFNQGVQLAKLVNPDLRGGVKVNVHTGGGAAAVAVGDPRSMVAGLIRQFELQGFKREEITPAMIQGAIEAMQDPSRQQQALEAPRVIDQSA